MNDIQLVKGFLDGLRPEPRLTVSEWSDRYRMLDATASSESGHWRTERTPYLKQIMDNLSANSPYTEIVVMKGAQLGFTEAGYNWVGYVIDCAPGPMLMMMPTDATVKRNTKIRFDPMVNATTRLKDRISEKKSRESGNTLTQKDFPGGFVVMCGANSPASLKSLPVRYLMLDEIDEYPIDLGEQGSPMDLARVRTRTFPNKKIFIGSTPTVHGASVIESEFLQTDQRYYHVPCPHCEQSQTLVFTQLKWDKDKPETVLYYCIHCGAGIQERFKTAMLKAGNWISSKPELASFDKVGYHINSLYSPYGWYSWHQMVKDYLKATIDTSKMKTFVNTVLGETWKEAGEQPDWAALYNRRGDYEFNRVPQDVVFLTAGVDVQKDRLELEIVGWARGKRSYSIDYRILQGDTAAIEVWDALAEIVNETWKRADGLQMKLRIMAVDSGYNTNFVYNFCRRFSINQVVPVKGGHDSMTSIFMAPKPVDITKAGKKVGKIKVYMLGVSIIKQELYGWLRQESNEEGRVPAGWCAFPGYTEDYFKQLVSEKYIKTIVKGYAKYVWQPEANVRQEALDCRVYNRGAAAIAGMDRWSDEQWDRQSYLYQQEPRKREIKESIWN